MPAASLHPAYQIPKQACMTAPILHLEQDVPYSAWMAMWLRAATSFARTAVGKRNLACPELVRHRHRFRIAIWTTWQFVLRAHLQAAAVFCSAPMAM